MPLTDTAAKNAKAGQTIKKLSDGGGLQLWIMPSGSKLWCLAYRDQAGKQQKLSFGPYPDISLVDARAKRSEARRLLALGIDPRQHANQEKANKAIAEAIAKANTFEALASELLARKKREGKASNTIGKREWLYGLAGEAFGKRPIAEISAPEILCVLQKVEARGHLETARRGACARASVRFSGLPSPPGGQSRTRHLRFVEPSQSRRSSIGLRS